MSTKRKGEEIKGNVEKKQKAGIEKFVYVAPPPKSGRKKGDLWQNKNGDWKKWDGKVYRKVCEDCKNTRAVYGMLRDDGSLWPKWCKECADLNHAEEYEDFSLKCEDCKIKTPKYGVFRENGQQWRRWCKACAEQKHPNEFIDFHLKCEDCKKKQPHCGVIRDDGTWWRRWCMQCGREKHADEFVDFNSKCEDCKQCRPTCGIIRTNGKNWLRWCTWCAEKNHAKEYIDFQQKCEDCREKIPRFGIVLEDGTVRRLWCKKCAEANHTGQYKDCYAKCIMDCGKQPNRDGYCTTCHPDYIPTMAGASKQACEFLDELERELKVTIQHTHYDISSGSIIRNEKKIEGTKYRADGFVTEGKLPFLSKEKGTIIEFHGVEFHGYPNNEHKEEKNQFGKTYGDLYDKTLKREQEISSLGYTIIRIFSTQYEEWKKHRVGISLMSCCTVI